MLNYPVAGSRFHLEFQLPSATLRVFTAVLLTLIPSLLLAQVQRKVSTAKEITYDRPIPHPLSWWTKNPLRLDASGNLLIGLKASDGQAVTTRDYSVRQEVLKLGTIAGLQIVQVLTNITPGPRLIASGRAPGDGPSTQWKSLLMQDGNSDRYVEIYKLQAESGTYQPFEPARIYGVGPNSILVTYDPDSGNGGGCDDGYWWFDKAGAHAVDFSPLNKAIGRAIPHNSTCTPNCWALHPEKGELQSWVHRIDAECHACGGVGTIRAQYKIERGAAIPVSIHFESEKNQ